MPQYLWGKTLSLTPAALEPAVVNDFNGALPFVFIVTVPDSASSNIDLVIPYAFRIIDVVVWKTAGAGAASNTITINAGASGAVTNAMDLNVADKAVVRALTLDDAFWTFAAGDTLRISWVKSGGNSAAACRIHAVRV